MKHTVMSILLQADVRRCEATLDPYCFIFDRQGKPFSQPKEVLLSVFINKVFTHNDKSGRLLRSGPVTVFQ